MKLSLISLLSFLLPTQLAFHINSLSTTVYGFKIDYLIPTLYLTDIVAVFIIILGLKKIKITKRFMLYAVVYMVFVALNIYMSDYFISNIYRWIKITEMFLLGLVIFNTKKFDVFKHFVKPLSYSMFIVCILGIWQFLIKSSVGGIFYWLGERSFVFSDPNIAPYPYSIFSHPNSFAGFLLVFGIFLLEYKNKFNFKFFWSLLILVIVNLILTNSLNVYITTAILLLLRYRKNVVLGFGFLDFGARFVTHRIELIKASFQMIKENFWFGVGLNNFIPRLPSVHNLFVNSWELQPVHNIFLLVFSEVGVFGFIAFCVLFFSSFSLLTTNYQLLTILITGLSDHYWLTLQQNLLIFTYVVIISRKKKL